MTGTRAVAALFATVALAYLAVCVLLGLWIAHILRMWGNLFKRDE